MKHYALKVEEDKREERGEGRDPWKRSRGREGRVEKDGMR